MIKLTTKKSNLLRQVIFCQEIVSLYLNKKRHWVLFKLINWLMKTSPQNHKKRIQKLLIIFIAKSRKPHSFLKKKHKENFQMRERKNFNEILRVLCLIRRVRLNNFPKENWKQQRNLYDYIIESCMDTLNCNFAKWKEPVYWPLIYFNDMTSSPFSSG